MPAKSKETAEATVTAKGQVTVPVSIRRALGIATGDKLVFALDKRGVVSITAQHRVSILDVARKHRITPQHKIDDIDALIESAVDEEMAERDERRRLKSAT
jgi:AbrB family looped-hinge helix DNA binding protein